MTDVPTIGSIYNPSLDHSMALIYFSGLGRPFHNGGYDDPRHWLNRTWTVQEVVSDPLLGGATPLSPTLHPQQAGILFNEFYRRFNAVFPINGMTFPLFSQYVAMMRERHATNELDRIYVLARISQPEHLPIYDAYLSSEDAWEALVKAISGLYRAYLFFWYPVAGNAKYSWIPTWSHIMAEDVPVAHRHVELLFRIDYDKTREEFHGRNFSIIDDCSVLGFDLSSLAKSSGSPVIRTGTIVVKDRGTKILREYGVTANHQVELDKNARYTLILPSNLSSERIVLGVKTNVGAIQKLCVLDFVSQESTVKIVRMASQKDVVLI